MARSIYVMPLLEVAHPKYGTERRPKYRDLYEPDLDRAEMTFYGWEEWCMVAITDVTPSVDADLGSTVDDDVFEIPSNLDNQLGNTTVRNTVRSRLEFVNIPGDNWVQTTTTWREVVRFVFALCQYAQAYGDQYWQANDEVAPWFSGGITLASTFNALPLAARQAMQAAGARFNMDTSGITGATTLRVILTSVGNQYISLGHPLTLEGPL